jgi:hypothetical protein
MQTEIVADGGVKERRKGKRRQNVLSDRNPSHDMQPKHHFMRHKCKALMIKRQPS